MAISQFCNIPRKYVLRSQSGSRTSLSVLSLFSIVDYACLSPTMMGIYRLQATGVMCPKPVSSIRRFESTSFAYWFSQLKARAIELRRYCSRRLFCRSTCVRRTPRHRWPQASRRHAVACEVGYSKVCLLAGTHWLTDGSTEHRSAYWRKVVCLLTSTSVPTRHLQV